MQDNPTPSEILAAAAAFLRDEIVPLLPDYHAFKTRILANALDLVQRQILRETDAGTAALERLHSLLGKAGTFEQLNRELAEQIETGRFDLTDRALVDHLWASTLDKLAVDQPNYASYRASLENNTR
jgi:hypothetical protein